MSVRTENYAFALIVSALLCLSNVGCMSNGLMKSDGFGWLGSEKTPNLTRDPSFPPPSSIGAAQTATQMKRSNPLANAAANPINKSQAPGLPPNAIASATPRGYALPSNAPMNTGSHSRAMPPANNMVQTGLYDVPVVPEPRGQIAATPPQNFAPTSPAPPSTNMYTGAEAIPLPKPGTVAQVPTGGGSTRSIYERELDGPSGAGALMSHNAPIEPPPTQNPMVKPLEAIQPLVATPIQPAEPATPIQPVEPIAPPVAQIPYVAAIEPPPPTILHEPTKPIPSATETAPPPAATFYQSQARQATAWRPGSTSDLKTL